MENTIKWLAEKQVISSTVYMWDADDLAKHILQVNNMVNSSDEVLVHTLWDFREMMTYPTNLNDIRQAIQPLFSNKKLGWVVTVMENPMVGFLAKAGSSMYGVRYRTFKTMDEAKAFLRLIDPMLPS